MHKLLTAVELICDDAETNRDARRVNDLANALRALTEYAEVRANGIALRAAGRVAESVESADRAGRYLADIRADYSAP